MRDRRDKADPKTQNLGHRDNNEQAEHCHQRKPRLQAGKQRDADQRGDSDRNGHGNLQRREVTADDICDPEQVEPNQRHKQQPKQEGRKGDPARRTRTTEAENNGYPGRQRLHDVPEDKMTAESDAEHQGCNDGE